MLRVILVGLSIVALPATGTATAAAASPPLILSTSGGGKLAEGTPLQWTGTKLVLEPSSGPSWHLEPPHGEHQNTGMQVSGFPFVEAPDWAILFNEDWEASVGTGDGEFGEISPYAVAGEAIPWVATLKSDWTGTITGVTPKVRFVLTTGEGLTCTFAASKIELRFVAGAAGEPHPLEPVALATKFKLDKEHSEADCPKKLTLTGEFDVTTLETPEQVLAES